MLAVIPFLLFASVLVDAAPFERRASAIVSNCGKDFSYTWDDGPYTSHDKINKIFSDASSHTTFYINGDNYSCIYEEANVKALRASFEAGHQLAHHTWSHPDLQTLSYAQIDVEIGRLNDAFIRILGVKPKFFRPPFGSVTESIASYIQEKFGLTVVLWSDDSLDASGKNTEKWNYDYYTDLATKGTGPRLTLSHETVLGSVEALGNGTVTNLKAAHINLVTTAECMNKAPYEVVTGHYGTRDSTWTCSGTWVPGNFPPQTSSTTTSSTRTSTSTSTTRTSTSTTGTSTSTTRASTSTTPTTSSTTSTSASATPTTTCAWYSPDIPTTCDKVGAIYGIPGTTIKALNSFVNCADIWAGTWLCVPAGTTTTPPPTSSTSSVSPTCTSWFTPTTSTTCDKVGTIYGVPGTTIQALNSFVNCADIWSGTNLCVPSSSPTTSAQLPSPSCASTYSAGYGDTCASIAKTFGLDANAISSANSFLNCADIWAYTPICIPSQCTKTITSTVGDNCDKIAQSNGVSKNQIIQWNSFLNCADIWQGTPVCVAHT